MINRIKYSIFNLFRQKKRISLILFTIVITSFVIVFIGGLYNYMFREVYRSEVNGNGDCWVVLREGSGFPSTIVDSIKDIDGIDNFLYRGSFSGIVGAGDKSAIFLGNIFNGEKEKKFYKNANVNVRMGKTLAHLLNIGEGDEFSGFGDNYSFSASLGEIVDLTSEEENLYYLAIGFADAGIDKSLESTVANSIHFHTKNKRAMEEIFSLFGDDSLYELHSATEDGGYFSSIKNIFESNLLFVIVALSITMFFSLSILFSLLINESLAEYGIRKALGEGEISIVLDVLFEALILCVVGVILGILLAEILGRIINIFGGIVLPPLPTLNSSITIKFVSSFVYPLLAMGIVIPIVLFTAIITSFSIGNKSIRECLDL